MTDAAAAVLSVINDPTLQSGEPVLTAMENAIKVITEPDGSIVGTNRTELMSELLIELMAESDPRAQDLLCSLIEKNASQGRQSVSRDVTIIDILKDHPEIIEAVFAYLKENEPAAAQELANQVLKSKDIFLLRSAWATSEMPTRFSESAIVALRENLNLAPAPKLELENCRLIQRLQTAYQKLGGSLDEVRNAQLRYGIKEDPAMTILITALSIPEERCGGEIDIGIRIQQELQQWGSAEPRIRSEGEVKSVGRMIESYLGPVARTTALAVMNGINAQASGCLNDFPSFTTHLEILSNALVSKQEALRSVTNLINKMGGSSDNYSALVLPESYDGRDVLILGEVPYPVYLNISPQIQAPTNRKSAPNTDNSSTIFEQFEVDGRVEYYLRPLKVTPITNITRSGSQVSISCHVVPAQIRGALNPKFGEELRQLLSSQQQAGPESIPAIARP